MSDPMKGLFTAVLEISSPRKVGEVRFEPEAHAVYFDLVCEATRLPCPVCAAPDQPIHDRLQNAGDLTTSATGND